MYSIPLLISVHVYLHSPFLVASKQNDEQQHIDRKENNCKYATSTQTPVIVRFFRAFHNISSQEHSHTTHTLSITDVFVSKLNQNCINPLKARR